ncbi:hypothetical protein N7512_002264 [Penicillium capsulatum]|nr:hypothetical protein N7512_002264 [Penicillium capsulatum]
MSLSSCCSNQDSSDEIRGSTQTAERRTFHTPQRKPIPSDVDERFNYGRLQYIGMQLRQSIEDSNKMEWAIPPSTLTSTELRREYQFNRISKESTLEVHYKEVAIALGLPWMEKEPKDTDLVYRKYAIVHPTDIVWVGWTGPGILVLDNIERPLDSPAPPISQISQALYQRCHSMSNLRYVFVTHVINDETSHLVTKLIYSRDNGLVWNYGDKKPIALEPQTWPRGSDEYDALLGSQIGKVVAYLVLGGFERGTRRIARIMTWPAERRRLMMRFDIEIAG